MNGRVRIAFELFCKEYKINPDGQFAEQDGYMFEEGYKHGVRSKKGVEVIIEEADDRAFRASESHVLTMTRLTRLRTAATAVLREALDNVTVHPCDENNDEVKAKKLTPEMYSLYQELKK